MRAQLCSLALVVVLVAACGGGAAASNPSAATAAGGASPATGQAASPAPGKTDCTTLKKAAATALVGIQILAQMRSPDTVQAVKDKVVGNFDADQFIAAMQQLHALDGVTTPLGNPKAAIDTYIAAATAAKDLLAKGSVTQADVDAYLTKVGTISDFIGGQAPISAALSSAGC